MSASLTGEVLPAPLCHIFSGPRNFWSASAPASRTAETRSSRSRVCSAANSATGNCEALHAHGRCIGAVAEFQVVGRSERAEQIEQVPRDGHLAHRKGALAVLNPEAGGAPAVIPGDGVDAHADQV